MYLVQCRGSMLFATELLLTDRPYAKCSTRCTNSVSKVALKILIIHFFGASKYDRYAKFAIFCQSCYDIDLVTKEQ